MKKVSAFAVTTFILLAIICFSITGTVLGQAKNQSKIENAYRDKMEEVYIVKVRELLESKYLHHSGITLTKVIDTDGQITYQMMIHNQSIDRMSYCDKQKLLKELQEVTFPDADSTISHQFLEI